MLIIILYQNLRINILDGKRKLADLEAHEMVRIEQEAKFIIEEVKKNILAASETEQTWNLKI